MAANRGADDAPLPGNHGKGTRERKGRLVDGQETFELLHVAASQTMAQFGYIEGVGFAPIEKPRYNYTHDPYYTDGLRVVLMLAEGSVSLDQIEWLDESTLFMFIHAATFGGNLTNKPFFVSDGLTHLSVVDRK